MSGMNFNPIKTGFPGPRRGTGKASLGVFYFRHRHGAGHIKKGAPPDITRRYQLAPVKDVPGGSPGMVELNGRFATFLMNGLDQFPQSREEPIIIDVQLPGAYLTDGGLHTGDLDNVQTHTALCPGPVIIY